MADLLLHVAAPHTWRMALAAGTLAPPSLVTDGFVHLSTVEQVALPANALFAGRTDLVALVVDPARLPGELRWEPGAGPDDPPGMRFPHHYGALPAASVVAVAPYRPGADGRFAAPTGLPAPDDVERRVRLFDRSLAERRAAALFPVSGGVAVIDPRFPFSFEHNCLWIDAAPAEAIAADADRVLGGAGLKHRRVMLHDGQTAAELARLGWTIEEMRLMVYRGPPAATIAAPAAAPTVVPVTHAVVARLWERSWRRDLPDADPASIGQLIAREPVADAVIRVIDLAVLAGDGDPIASTQLRIDGATAAVTAVMTDPAHRGAGLARALLLDAVARAQAAGCDVVCLDAAADDWPREWYARFGFADVGARYEASLSR